MKNLWIGILFSSISKTCQANISGFLWKLRRKSRKILKKTKFHPYTYEWIVLRCKKCSRTIEFEIDLLFISAVELGMWQSIQNTFRVQFQIIQGGNMIGDYEPLLSLYLIVPHLTSGYYVRGGPYKLTLLIGHSISMPYFNKTSRLSPKRSSGMCTKILLCSSCYWTDALQTNYTRRHYQSWRDTPIRWAFDHEKLFKLHIRTILWMKLCHNRQGFVPNVCKMAEVTKRLFNIRAFMIRPSKTITKNTN